MIRSADSSEVKSNHTLSEALEARVSMYSGFALTWFSMSTVDWALSIAIARVYIVNGSESAEK